MPDCLEGGNSRWVERFRTKIRFRSKPNTNTQICLMSWHLCMGFPTDSQLSLVLLNEGGVGEGGEGEEGEGRVFIATRRALQWHLGVSTLWEAIALLLENTAVLLFRNWKGAKRRKKWPLFPSRRVLLKAVKVMWLEKRTKLASCFVYYPSRVMLG